VHDARGEGGGLLRVETGQEDVRGHDGARARRDGGAERHELAVAERLERQVDDRQREVGVGRGVAVAGEVLRARGHARRLEAAHPRGGVPRGELGVGAEAADADDRVVGIGVHVDVGREGHGAAGLGERLADRTGDPLGQVGVVDAPSSALPG
jgi:hypothetical protein